MLLTAAAFVFVLGVLIFVHELGHFLAAKAVGIGVLRFSIGFGRATPLRMRRGETEYLISWFPVGGYVKMASREEQEAMAALEGGSTGPESPSHRLFENKPLGARMLVVSAGVAMNALLAWGVYAGLAGAYGSSEDPTTAIARVDAGQLPAAALPLARIPAGTQVVRINGDTVRSWQAIARAVQNPTSDRLRFEFTAAVDPVVVPIPGTDLTGRAAVLAALKPLWEPRIGPVLVGGPAEQAGLKSGDLLVAINGDTLRVWDDLQRIVESGIGDTLRVTVRRGDSAFVTAVVPAAQTERDLLSGETRTVGRIGVGSAVTPIRVRYSLAGAIAEGLRQTLQDAGMVVFALKGMVTGRVAVRELGGPILIGQVSGRFARAGVVPLLVFMAFLSVNLAILNLLPIPVLDGGHLLFLLAEGIRGRPLPRNVRLFLTQLGMVVLVALMALVFANDIWRLIGG